MRPFLLLSTRADAAAADGEYEAVRRVMGLPAAGLARLRLEQAPLPELDLADYSGILLGGSEFCASDPAPSPVQRRVEADLHGLLDQILARDFPFLGLCYGVGVLASHLGGTVDHTYCEDVGAIPVSVTDAGRADPLLADLPEPFYAFVGHKEAARDVPPGAVLLARGDDCPVQVIRAGANVYAVQFHPELDVDGLIARMVVYQNAGYFDPADLEPLAAAARQSPVDGSQEVLLRRFAERYARP
jgi:GMP synthase (glutamine-hydrolysing)